MAEQHYTLGVGRGQQAGAREWAALIPTTWAHPPLPPGLLGPALSPPNPASGAPQGAGAEIKGAWKIYISG